MAREQEGQGDGDRGHAVRDVQREHLEHDPWPRPGVFVDSRLGLYRVTRSLGN
ncbi:Hypothetical protein AA314_02821 [Archangium gephyra]|uniref:Uncharacterized protein n=1 Tax=Archangium gephyra TaxID=48 RepID=A0AAC8Q512_9BACT|nr:Hypothetical protein AA314_02821 [Archangium gephyra]